VGGDAAEPAQREYASRYTAYLMLRTIGSLTQPTNPSQPEDYAAAMISAERGDWTSEGHVGAVYGKVVRWAFEKQGAFQPLGAPMPVVSPGPPPPVDLYIDDGRHGEYGFQARFWETRDLWNRHQPDGEHGHQTPHVCCVNHAYVKVKNRGTQTARGARVHAYHCRPSAGLVWPDDFEAMTTASRSVPDLAPGAEVVIGPFAWTPVYAGHEGLFMSVTASEDRANNDRVTGLSSAKGPTPAWRLVPSDNNIAMRALIPVPGGGGRCALEAAFCNRRFWAQNPFGKTARMELRVVMPPLLALRGWALRFANPGGANFMLGARGEREIRPVLMSGRDFDTIDVVDAGSAIIGVLVLADGIVVGGLSFALDAAMTEPAREREPCEPKQGRQEPKDDPDCGKPMKPAHRSRCCCEPCIDDRCRKPCCCCCEDKKPCDDKPAEDDGCDAEPR
jgi:zinc metalloprotease ZmpB